MTNSFFNLAKIIFVLFSIFISFVSLIVQPTMAEIVNNDYAWTKTVGGTGLDESWDIATDTSGNVYMIGEFRNTVLMELTFGPKLWVELPQTPHLR